MLYTRIIWSATAFVNSSCNAFIDIAAESVEDTDNIRLLVSNSCKEAPDLEKSKNRTDGHGVGLVSIQKIIRKYNGRMDMYFKEEDSSFHTIILMQAENH